MNAQALDRYLTTEPDNGYISWLDKIWELIPQSTISADEYDKYEDFFDALAQKLSTAGRDGFVDPEFAAKVIIRRFNSLKSWLAFGKRSCPCMHQTACTCATEHKGHYEKHTAYQTCTCAIGHCQNYYMDNFTRLMEH